MSCHPVFQCSGHSHGNSMELTNILIQSLVYKYLESNYEELEDRVNDSIDTKILAINNKLNPQIVNITNNTAGVLANKNALSTITPKVDSAVATIAAHTNTLSSNTAQINTNRINIAALNNDSYLNLTARRNKEALPKHTPRNMLFVGDSLTEDHTDSSYTTPRDTYARSVAEILAGNADGFKEVGYVALSTQNVKDLKGQISISRIGFTDMWGDSDHKWEQMPYKYSPDGHGFYTNSSNTTDYIYVNTVGLIKTEIVKVYYLKQPNGGTFRIGYGSTPAANRLVINTESTVAGVGIAEFAVKNISERIVISSDLAGKPLALYGLELLNPSNPKGITANYWARSGSMLQGHNYLSSMPEYYSSIKPDTIFLNIGTNDALQDFSRLPPEQFRNQLIIYMDRVRSVLPNTMVYIIEPNRAAIYGTDDAGNGEGLLLEAYSKERKEVANLYENCYYVDVPTFAGDYRFFHNSLYMADALHPNAFGKYYIARKIVEFLGLDVAPYIKYDLLSEVAKPNPKSNLTPIFKKQEVTTTPVLLSTYGLEGSGINAFFDIEVVVATGGKMIVNNIMFYALKTVQAGNEIFEIRGVVTNNKYRLDAQSSTSGIELTATKNANNLIEIKAALSGTWIGNATEWSLSGSVIAASSNYLVEL